MGGDRAYTAAELRQQEKDQQDPAWLAWLAAMPDALDTFLTEDVPDMPADPWTADGLCHAERAALALFPTWESVREPQNRALADRIRRFIGEVFIRNFDGEWRNVPQFNRDGYPGFGPVVSEPYTEMYLTVGTKLTAALDRRTGTGWAQIFGYSVESHAAWTAAGKPPLSEWVVLRSNA